jgi:5-formyltetrahydrofolate cyclo-ligase
MADSQGPSEADRFAEHLGAQMKAILRKRMRGVRKALAHQDVVDRSERICAALTQLPFWSTSTAIALFWPMEGRNEVDLRSLDEAIRTTRRIAYPSLDRDTNLMTFRWVEAIGQLEERGSGFSEPSPDATEATALDLVVVPCLAIDPRGHRIGYGAGYYDRTLPRFAPPARTVAVAFDFQLVAEVPITAHDRAVDMVVTDRRVLEVSR